MWVRTSTLGLIFGILLTSFPIGARAELLCRIKELCIEGVCDTPTNNSVILITPSKNRGSVEFGTYQGLFKAQSEFRLPKPLYNILTGSVTYRWSTQEGGKARLKITPDAQQTEDEGIQNYSFTYSRPVSVGAQTATAVSAGNCFNPQNVLLGPGFVPGIVRSDDNERYFSIPEHRALLAAHCSLERQNQAGVREVYDMWLYREDKDLFCVREPGSDSLFCLHRVVGQSGAIFVEESSPAVLVAKLTIAHNGHGLYTEVYPALSDTVEETRRYTGTCEKGPAL